MSRGAHRSIVILAAALLTAGGLLLAPRSARLVAGGGEEEETQREPLRLSLHPKLIEIRPGDDELRRLLVERYNAADEELRYAQAMVETGIGTVESVINAARHLGVAAIALADSKAEQVRLRQELVKLAERLEESQRKRVEVGVGSPIELHRARYARIEAQIDLVLAKRAAGK